MARAALKDDHVDSEAPINRDYGAEYYASHCGSVPYERNDHWLAFFGGIADRIVSSFSPVRAYDAGCALGFLTEALWDRGVECWGRDISTYAISQVRIDMRPFCDVGSIAEPPPGPGQFDLVTCIEVVEHMPEAEALAALDVLTAAAPRLLFSSSPTDLIEPTHINVRPVIYWLREFAKRGFRPEWTHNAMYLAPHAFVTVRTEQVPGDAELQLFAEWIRIRSALIERESRIGSLSVAIAKADADLSAAVAKADADLSAVRARADTVTAALHAGERVREQLQRDLSASSQAEQALRHIIEDLTTARCNEAEHVAALQNTNETLRNTNDALAAAATRLNTELDARHAAALLTLQQSERRVRDMGAMAAALRLELQAIQSSSFWRATGPLRRVLVRSPNLRYLARGAGQIGKLLLVWRIPARRRARLQWGSAMAPSVAVASSVIPFPGFDGEAYLAANPDVAAAGIDPGQHWLECGLSEGRHITISSNSSNGVTPVGPAASRVVDYADWIAWHRLEPAELDLQRRLLEEFSHQPLVSVLTPVYRVDADVLNDTIRSVVEQVYPNWELCLAIGDTSDEARMAVLRRWEASDTRIRIEVLTENGGISRNSDATLAMAKGEWAVLLDHDDLLTPDALFHLVRVALADPNVAMIYSDKDQVGADGTTRQIPLLKQAWAPDIMLNANYLTHLNMMRVDRMREIGGWDPDTDGAQDWDLFLRVIGSEGRVIHVPRVLYHWRQVLTSVAAGGIDAKPYASDAQVRTITKHLQHAGWSGAAAIFDGTMPRVVWPPQWRPSVSLLVLRNGAAVRPPSFTWPENVEVLAAPGALLDGTAVGDSIADPAVMLDALAAMARGDVLVVVDAGLELLSPDWLEELVGPLANPAIAVVAGVVTSPGGTIEAFGAFCVDGEVRPGYKGIRRNQGGPYGHASWYGNASATPLRFSALRRADWQNVADHRMAGRSDLSMTLALAQHRGRILLNPFATTVARAPDLFQVTDHEALRTRFISALPDGDPFVSPHLVFADTGWLTFRMPSKVVSADHNFTAEARYVAGAYDATASLVAASVTGCAAAPTGTLTSVCWVVPPFDVPFYGGIYTILRVAEFMRTEHDVRPFFSVIGIGRGRETPDAVRATIARAFPGLAAAAQIEVLRDAGQDLGCGPVDAVISTLWTTAFPALRFTQARRKFYFLQDWEPLFYPAGSISAMVEATYRFGFHAICNTPALAKSYRDLGGEADYFMPAVDPNVFRPRRDTSDRNGPFRLFCYARPGTPRNGFETLAVALRELKQRHGEAIDVITAGAEWQPEVHGLNGVVRHLGLLPYAETGALYRACDAGLVAMATRHPSYLPFEFMASGAAVITNRNAYTDWLLHDGENAVLCELTHSDIVRAVEVVMSNRPLREKIVKGGYDTIHVGHSDWSATCEVIYTSIEQICCKEIS
jgi:glycosyltransferase involved in cell wall biosynthesis